MAGPNLEELIPLNTGRFFNRWSDNKPVKAEQVGTPVLIVLPKERFERLGRNYADVFDRRRAWQKACSDSGIVGKVAHDFNSGKMPDAFVVGAYQELEHTGCFPWQVERSVAIPVQYYEIREVIEA